MKEDGITLEDMDKLVEIIQKREKEKVDRSWLDDMDIRKEGENTIIVRSPLITWKERCGREWTFDLEKGDYKLTAMN